jgi:hypothetical protein
VRQRDFDSLVQEERTEIVLKCNHYSNKLKKSQTSTVRQRDCDWLLQEEITEIIETIVVIK